MLFVSCVLIIFGSFDGLPQKYLWPASPWWANQSVLFSIVFDGIWLTLFTRDFLDTKRHLPRWSTALSVMAVLCAIASVLSLVLSYRSAVKISTLYAIFVLLASVVVGFLSWRKGVRPARYFLLGWTVALIGFAALSSTKFGILPRNFLIYYGGHIGLALNAILLSFALADRINIIREEKEQAQKEALQVQKNAAENLEQEVERKTLDLQKRTQEAEKATQEAVEAKEELALAYESLAEHDQLKSRFFANVSHELRTPLTLILTPLQRLMARDLAQDPEASRQQLRSMVGNTQRLLGLVNPLLDFSRIESGAATVAFELRDIRAMAAALIQGFMPFARSEGLKQDARRCARMAIEMWQRAVEVSGRWRDLLALDHPPLPTMVLTSGSATVGNFGSSRRLEYTAIGAPLDEAGTLLQQVGPGEVACSQTTWTLIKGEVEGELSNEVKVHSRERPVKLFRIAGPAQLIASTPAQAKPPAHDKSEESSTGDSDKLQEGTVLASRYQILQALGKSSIGTVYMARDLKLEVEVALKLAQNAPDADTSRHERLHREVMLTRMVHHASVAQIFDLGEWQGYEFIIMEHIQGDTLEQRLETTGALSVAEGQRVLQQLCAGLGVAHAASLVHRDLKPSNIILGPDGRVVILDFGVARWVSALHQTESGARRPVGTPSYMAPEQFKSGEVDQRADIYSLGVVAFEMFTGHRPFDGDSTAKLERMHTQEAPPDPLQLKSDLPPRLTAVILRCLEKSPQDRFSSVVEIPSMLEESNS